MQMTYAEKISLKNFLNAFFREHADTHFIDRKDGVYMQYNLLSLNLKMIIKLSYFSKTGRHQYDWPVMLEKENKKYELHPWCLVGMLLQDLAVRYPEAKRGHREFLQRFFNSCDNLDFILQELTDEQINALFQKKVSFQQSENGLLLGHQLHPAPKSREGFDREAFKLYSPELRNSFQLHYFLINPEYLLTDSDLPLSTSDLMKECFDLSIDLQKKIIVPQHPWQANYLKTMPTIRKWLAEGTLIDLGLGGKKFTATSSVRTVYSNEYSYMFKFSLNILITNSLRLQYTKELERGLAAHRFWKSPVGEAVKVKFPRFKPITDPAFLCFRDGNKPISETAVLIRENPFVHDNNVTSLATLCQDHPFKNGNRFTTLIEEVALQNHISLEDAARMWFQQFLEIAIEPILWLFVKYGIAVESHQQNMLLEIRAGLPIASFYRDNQGYYIVNESKKLLRKKVDSMILQPFCEGSKEFIGHHLIYYLIGNSLFGVINALGTVDVISENYLLTIVNNFLKSCHVRWPQSNYLLPHILSAKTLPFKANLLTRFHELDELVMPLEQQSVYVQIDNIIK